MESLSFIENEKIPFPLLRDRLQNPYELFENLQKYIPKTIRKCINYKFILWKTNKYQKIKYKNTQYISIVTQPTDYFEIDRLVDYFNELPRMKARRRDKKYSPLEAWDKMEILEPYIKEGNPKNSLELREQLWKMGLECNAFKSTLAKSIFLIFQSKRILDFSAGWGDRLLAALSLKVDRYLGYDPNPELQKGYIEMIDLFTKKEYISKYEVKMEPFETSEINEMFDTILTSPPYYDFETYISSDSENAKTQSIVKYPDFHSWMVYFLFKSLLKCWECLLLNGNMIIHLSDVYKTNYVEAMIIFILGWCKGSRFDGSIASIGDCGKPRPLWVFHKTMDITVDLSAREYMKQYYNEFYKTLSSCEYFI
jgi:hypothetical protein